MGFLCGILLAQAHFKRILFFAPCWVSWFVFPAIKTPYNNLRCADFKINKGHRKKTTHAIKSLSSKILHYFNKNKKMNGGYTKTVTD
jgi:hypothetical protein